MTCSQTDWPVITYFQGVTYLAELLSQVTVVGLNPVTADIHYLLSFRKFQLVAN